MRIEIAGVRDEGCMNQRVETGSRGSARHGGSMIRGQSPAGIERRPEAVQLFPAQQPFETHERGHRPDNIRLIEQIGRRAVARDDIRKPLHLAVA